MPIEVCLGIWHDHVAIGMHLDTLAEIERYLGASTFRLSLRKDRTVVLEKGDDAPSRCGEQQQVGYELRLRGLRDDFKVARCQNHWVRMVEDDVLVHSFYSFKLQLDHKMPWPRVRKCDSYWVPDEIFREIIIRRQSTLQANERWAMPPASITQHLEPKQRMQLQSMKHMDGQNASMLNPARFA